MTDCQTHPWDPRLAPLLKRCAEIRDLNAALAVLGWDQQVYTPVYRLTATRNDARLQILIDQWQTY